MSQFSGSGCFRRASVTGTYLSRMEFTGGGVVVEPPACAAPPWPGTGGMACCESATATAISVITETSTITRSFCVILSVPSSSNQSGIVVDHTVVELRLYGKNSRRYRKLSFTHD